MFFFFSIYSTKLIFLCLVHTSEFVQNKRSGIKKVSITKSSQLNGNINICLSTQIKSSLYI